MESFYKCCRCGYTTSHKSSIKHHLWNRKVTCEPLNCTITLTDEIKGHVLYDKMYITNEKEFELCDDSRNRMIYLVRKYLCIYECILIESGDESNLESYYSLIKKYGIIPFVGNIVDMDHTKYKELYENTRVYDGDTSILMMTKPSWEITSDLINFLNFFKKWI